MVKHHVVYIPLRFVEYKLTNIYFYCDICYKQKTEGMRYINKQFNLEVCARCKRRLIKKGIE